MKFGNTTYDRRNFLTTMGILAGSAALAPVMRVLPAHASAALVKTTEQRMLMGTFVGLTVLTPSSAQGEDVLARAYAAIEQYIRTFDRFSSTSPLSVLNQTGRLQGAPQELLDVIDHGQRLSRLSGGHFDATVAPVVNLMARTAGRPDKSELREALALVNAGGVRRSGANLDFAAADMALTLDGIAKGFIADQAAVTLQGLGVEHFLIDAGGDLRAAGCADGQSRPWRVAIEDPGKQGVYPAVISMTSGAVATSGGYEVFYDRAGSSTHLIDPKTGTSPQYIRSVSVKAPTVMQADGLATALSLMSTRDALRLIASLPGHSCLIITSTGAKIVSPDWA